jgi:DNA-binding LacI/PurR family transcriptional regulator
MDRNRLSKPVKNSAPVKKTFIGKGQPDIIRTKSQTIALLSERIGSAFVSMVARGVEERVTELGWGKNSILYHSPRDMKIESSQAEFMDILKQEEARGIILVSMLVPQEALDAALEKKVELVFVERQVVDFHSVKVDNFSGGFKAGEFLAKSGYKKPTVILDPQADDINSASHDRFLGFKSALRKYGLSVDKSCMTKVAFHTIEHGRQAMEKLGKKIKKVDSFFSVAGDLAAIGFMIEAKSAGIRVPQDMAVIGFDDMEMASAVEPGLTTIRQPIQGMGIEAVNILNEALNNRSGKIHNTLMETSLVKRESA